MCFETDMTPTINLHRWRQSGAPARWVESHGGAWGHDEWLGLLASLEKSEYWPLDPEGVGGVLEEIKRQRNNLRRWIDSGEPERWVQERQGRWSHDDWVALLEKLRASGFWPLDPDDIGRALEDTRITWWNLKRWVDSGEPARWVEEHRGQWGHDDWVGLLQGLRESVYWPLDERGVGALLEGQRRAWWNLRQWLEGEGARRWVEEHQGQWGHDDWLALIDQMRGPAGPLDFSRVGGVLEDLKRRWWVLRRWVDSGRARAWIEAHQGQWDREDWQELVATLEEGGKEPVDLAWLEGLLRRLQGEWWNLRRWHSSGLARRWVEEHQGGWTPEDWGELLEGLRDSDFWPMHQEALGELLEGLKAEGETACALPFLAGLAAVLAEARRVA